MITALVLLVGWALCAAAYVVYMHIQSIRETFGLSLFWEVSLFPILLVGALYDVFVLNLGLATAMFLEIPKWREWTFSQRVSRHAKKGSRIALFWARTLNEMGPHIDVGR